MANEAEKVAGELKSFFEKGWEKLEPEAKVAGVEALQSFEQKLTPDAINLMEDAVEYTASIGLTDVAAREAAIAKFVQDGKQAGVDAAAFAKNELNALVEIVVIAVKGKLSAATTTTTNGNGSTAPINSSGSPA